MSFISLNNPTQRIDSEYFQKKFLKEGKILESKNCNLLQNVAFIQGGKRLPLDANFEEEGIPYIRAEDVKNNFVRWEESPKISLELHKQLLRYQTKKDDVLITIVGNSIGDIGFVQFDLLKCNLTENCVRIVSQSLSPSYLFIFLKTRFGQNLIQREKVGTAQPKLAIERIRLFNIPLFSLVFQQMIELTVKKAYYQLSQSQELYQQAERVLLEELGLVGFKPSTQGVSIKTFAQSFGTTGRLDAEYYQPKYDEMVKYIRTAPHNRLGEVVNIQKSIEPGSEHYADEGIPFLRVSDLNKSGITEPNKKLSVAFCKENATLIQKLQPKKDTILFSKDGTVGIAHKLAEDKACITSGAILHLTVKNEQEVLPDYLTLVLNSSVVQLQAERDAGGSIIQHWRVSEIEEVVIPVFSIEKQQEIAGLVQESFRLKTQSEALLEIAKRGVELAIETTEAQAQSWMQSQLGSLNALLSFAPAYCQLPKV